MKKKDIAAMILGMIIYYIGMYVVAMKFSKGLVTSIQKIAIPIIAIIALFDILLRYKKEKKINYTKIFIYIFIIGIMLRTMYVSYTTINERQHDVDGDRGHLAYIEYVYENAKLPDNNEWQFYQQPLHHIISAIWLKINTMCKIDYEVAKEGLCILPAIYSGISMIIMYLILLKLKINEKFIPMVMAVVATHPSFIILSSSINNDMLVTMFLFLDILCLIKWDEKPSIKNTIILAILTALTVLSKISGALIALPISYVFIKKFFVAIKERKDVVKYILKFAVFGVISLSIGLSYSIRNKVLFDQAIGEVPSPGERVYCGYDSLIKRLNPISIEWNRLYCNAFEESSITIYITKSSLFGEWRPDNLEEKVLPILLITFNAILITISIISFIIITNPLKNRSNVLNILICFYFAQMLMYLASNDAMPYGCTMDFRYIVPTAFLGMAFIAEVFQKESMASQVAVKTLTYIFVTLSIVSETTLLYQLY